MTASTAIEAVAARRDERENRGNLREMVVKPATVYFATDAATAPCREDRGISFGINCFALKSPFPLTARAFGHSAAQQQDGVLVAGQPIAARISEVAPHVFLDSTTCDERARILAARLLLQGAHRIVIVNVPWYLRKRR